MKIKDVPQDGRRLLKTRLVHYAVDDEGAFQKVPSTGWDPGYYAGTNIQDEFIELSDQARERVRRGESSPLEYFMYSACLDIDAMAQFTGIPKRKVRKHLTPRGFDRLDDHILARYAHVTHTDVETIRKFKSTL